MRGMYSHIIGFNNFFWNPKARIEGKTIGRNGTKRTGGQSPQSSRAKAIVKEVRGGKKTK